MKILERISVIIFNICLLFSTVVIPALILASSPSYYSRQFEKSGIYGTVEEDGTVSGRIINYLDGKRFNSAIFTREQLDTIVDHTVDFLFGDKESFALTLDGVYTPGVGYRDGVNIFGEEAVHHMDDVKELMRGALVGAVACAIIAVGLFVFFITRRKSIGGIALKCTLIFYAAILGFALIFCAFTYLTAETNDFFFDLWKNIHYLLFPFQPDKIAGSFFNDTLTMILNIDLFMTAVIIVLGIYLAFIMLWLTAAVLLKRSAECK